MSELTKPTLADICTDVSYGYTESATKNPVGPKFLRITDIQGGVVDWQSVPYCPIDEAIIDKYLLDVGDIVVARTGNSTGENYAFSGNERAVFASYLIRFRVDDTKANPFFIWYQMRSSKWWSFVAGARGGSAQAGANAKTLGRFELDLLPREEQDRIADQLTTLNRKIALNNQINQTLEQIAQAIFKNWFVDFEPVKAKQHIRALGGNDEQTERAAQAVIAGAVNLDIITAATDLSSLDQQLVEALSEKLACQTDAQREQLATTASHFPEQLVDSELGPIPEGWDRVTIADVCDFQNGYAFKSKEMTTESKNANKIFKMGNIRKGGGLNRKGSKDYYCKEKCEGLDRYLVKKGDLLMCMTDMKNNVALLGHTALMDAEDEFILNQRVGLIRSKNREVVNFPFLNILTNSKNFIEDLRSRANSGVQVNLSTKEINNTQFLLPTTDVHESFDRLCVRTSEKGFELGRQSEKLENLRDLMLPKLLSGELEAARAA